MRQLLSAMAALTLVLPVVSSAADLGYFASFSAFADDDDNNNISSMAGGLEMETEDRDLADGENAISLNCESTGLEQEFDKSLEVDDREGESETNLSFANGNTYEGCGVGIGEKMKLDVDDGGVEVEVELEGLTLADGLYDAIFSCTEPKVNMTFADAFEVDDREGEFEADIALANGTYNNCELQVEGTVIATFS